MDDALLQKYILLNSTQKQEAQYRSTAGDMTGCHHHGTMPRLICIQVDVEWTHGDEMRHDENMDFLHVSL